MGLIKNQNASALLRDAVVLDLGDIASQADAIRRQAKKDAEHIVSEARRVSDRVLANKQQEGFDRGMQEGYKEGYAHGLKEGEQFAREEKAPMIADSLNAWTDALTVFDACRSNLFLEAKQDVLWLALEVAERVIYRVIEHDPTVIEDQMAETLRLLARRTAVAVHVNPRDLDIAREVMPLLIQQIDHCTDAAVVADADVSPGGCYVRAGNGEIDARIETQIQRIVETLLPVQDDSDAATDEAESSDSSAPSIDDVSDAGANEAESETP